MGILTRGSRVEGRNTNVLAALTTAAMYTIDPSLKNPSICMVVCICLLQC